jgi:rod shape-determining protein MreD
MKGILSVWVLFVGLVLAHFFTHVGLGLGRLAPDLLTVALLLAARDVGPGTAGGIGFLLGLMEDAFSVLAFGANTVAMAVAGSLGSLTRDLFVGESWRFYVLYLAIGKWLRDAMFWVFAGEQVRGPAVRALLVQAPMAALYAALVGVGILALNRAWEASEG